MRIKEIEARLVAPPRGVRGLKYDLVPAQGYGGKVAPPRGVRGLKLLDIAVFAKEFRRRTPSRGAWIEIFFLFGRHKLAKRRTPSRGAWIEIRSKRDIPRSFPRRTPSRGAWIEMCSFT